MDRRFRTWLTVVLTCTPILTTTTATSAPKDAAATKLADDAINTDYLATNFAEAEKKLRKAVQACGTSGCSAQVRARLHRDLGVVLVGGLNRPEDGKKAFIEALKADPNIALEKYLTTPEIDAAFQAAKGGGAPAGKAAPSPAAPAFGGDLSHTPPVEGAVNTPLALYAEIPDGITVARVIARYKPFGIPEWKTLEMRKMGNGYGGEVPCTEIGSATGDLSYYLQASDAQGDVVSTSGSRNAPNKVSIKNELAGEAPHLPGRPAPSPCREAADCPPGLPGCPAGKRSGTKGWGATCEKDIECAANLACKNGTCETGEKSDIDASGSGRACETNADCGASEACNADKTCESSAPRGKPTWLSLNVQQDFALLSPQSNVCGTTANEPAANVECRSSTGGPYLGFPEEGGPRRGNGINPGPAFASTRFLLGIDYMLTPNLSIGARAGYALNVYKKGPSPFHAEGRLTYWLGKPKGLRPFFVAMGGLQEIDAKQTVPINEAKPFVSKSKDAEDGVVRPAQDLTVWRKAGPGFVGLGAGLMIPTGASSGISAELRLQLLFPNSGLAISPSVGYALGF